MSNINEKSCGKNRRVKKIPKKKRKIKKKKEFTIAETFVGCGGSHFGFKKAGFKTVFVNDNWKDAIQTLKQNDNDITDEQIILDDINNITKEMLEKYKSTNVDVLIGGVVCKGFSLAGIRNPFDERNYLYLQQLRLVKILRPKISIIENVPGMKSLKILKQNVEGIGEKCNILTKICEEYKHVRAILINHNKAGNEEEAKTTKELLQTIKKQRELLEAELKEHTYSVVDDIKMKYGEMGYTVHTNVLHCNNYNCATIRKRLFIVATRNDTNIKWEYPQETTAENCPTVNDALSKLDYTGINNPETDIDNRPMAHKKKTVEKFKKISYDKKDKEKGTYFSRGTCSRLDPNKPAPTLVPGHSSFQIHPTEHRSITVREGGIITGFEPTFKFHGSHSSRCMQIGNAIPVNMAYHLAEQCKKYL
jgi:DNA (cytosine-5)-methyltransferase 1